MHAALLRFCLACFASGPVAGTGMLVAQEAGVPAMPLEESVRPTPAAGVEERLISVGEALAAANMELESLREQHAQLKLQMEALGIAAVKGDNRSLQTRLVAATSELRASEKARAELIERNGRLTEAAAAYLSKPGDSSLRRELERTVGSAGGSARSAAAEAVTLDAARVVSCKSELGLAVINAGRDSGVRTGAPLRIVRANNTIATGLVIDVRDRIAGVFITSPGAATVRVGDSVKAELIQTTPTK